MACSSLHRVAVAGVLLSLLGVNASGAPVERAVNFESESASLSGALLVPDDVSVSERIERIQKRLLPPVLIEGESPEAVTLAERMAALRVPGVSVADIRNIKSSTVTFVRNASGAVGKATRSEGDFSAQGVRLNDAGERQAPRARPDWASYFSDVGVEGTIVVSDDREASAWVYDETRAQQRYIPASTFKIPHTLFSLDAGIARDEFQIFSWDKTRREIESWNGDQNLRSALRNSVVWVYQNFARELGEEREQEYLKRIEYGNADASGGIDRFWLDGGLRISAYEQIAFLKRLYRNELPFRVEHQRLVKDLMIVEAGPGWILRAKTGWGAGMNPQVGWWVGWVERPEGAVFFALNIDMPKGGAGARKRQAITRAIFESIGALPAG